MLFGKVGIILTQSHRPVTTGCVFYHTHTHTHTQNSLTELKAKVESDND